MFRIDTCQQIDTPAVVICVTPSGNQMDSCTFAEKRNTRSKGASLIVHANMFTHIARATFYYNNAFTTLNTLTCRKTKTYVILMGAVHSDRL